MKKKTITKKKKKKNCKVAIQKKLKTKHVKTALLINTDITSSQILSLTDLSNSLSSNNSSDYSSTH